MDNSSPIYTEFLPISRADMEARGWDQLDFVVVGGDAYVDHPSFGTAIISRLLEAEGYKVGVLAQPRYSDCEDFKRFGRPKYGFFIGGGNVDSMVSHYSVAKIPRAEDEYSPGGIGGALVATIGLVTPSVIVILIVAAFLKAFRDSKWVSAAFYGLRPASTALVAAAGISVVPIALLHSGMTGLAALNWPAIALAAVLLVCTNWVHVVKKWHPIVFIGISALVGVLLKF